ncbi:hypothetical protein F5Y18DRAFT_405769 [Xylariaceae sp. FL1019]|nr:hypothetical protein F5Y18DRAFT_405769 [Xylariaceae sp. FL1019]
MSAPQLPPPGPPSAGKKSRNPFRRQPRPIPPRTAAANADYAGLKDSALATVDFFIEKGTFQFVKTFGAAFEMDEYRPNGKFRRKVIVKYADSDAQHEAIKNEYNILKQMVGAEHIVQLSTFGQETSPLAGTMRNVRRFSSRISALPARVKRALSSSGSSGSNNSDGPPASKRQKLLSAGKKIIGKVLGRKSSDEGSSGSGADSSGSGGGGGEARESGGSNESGGTVIQHPAPDPGGEEDEEAEEGEEGNDEEGEDDDGNGDDEDNEEDEEDEDESEESSEGGLTFPFLLPTGEPYFVMENITGGDLREFLERTIADNSMISTPALWSIFLCLTRACVAMAWPPGRQPGAKPRKETIRRDTEHSGIRHGDLHLANVMIGVAKEYDYEHQEAPLMKVIDFNISSTPREYAGRELEATADNIFEVGRAMSSLIIRREAVGYIYKIGNPRIDMPEININGVQVFQKTLEEGDPNDKYRMESPMLEFMASPNAPDDLKGLVLRCMAVEWQNRPTIEEILYVCTRRVEADSQARSAREHEDVLMFQSWNVPVVPFIF